MTEIYLNNIEMDIKPLFQVFCQFLKEVKYLAEIPLLSDEEYSTLKKELKISSEKKDTFGHFMPQGGIWNQPKKANQNPESESQNKEKEEKLKQIKKVFSD